MSDGQVGQFSDVLQINYQRKGQMVDSWLSSFGNVLHAPKGKLQSLIVDRIQIND
jgi:hypothetical protein